jgi:hypothetical protein
MIPVRIDASENCHCGRRDWTRKDMPARTVVYCAVCGYVVALVAGDSTQEG